MVLEKMKKENLTYYYGLWPSKGQQNIDYGITISWGGQLERKFLKRLFRVVKMIKS